MTRSFFSCVCRSALRALGCACLTAPALAGGLREVDQTIFGMDCAPCAHGVEQGLSKLPGVIAVRVSLNEGRAVVSLAPESRTTFADIRKVIRHNGFTPKESQALLVGRVLHEGERIWLDTGDAGRFVLEAGAQTLRTQLLTQPTTEDVALSVRVPETLRTPPAVQLIERKNLQPGEG